MKALVSRLLMTCAAEDSYSTLEISFDAHSDFSEYPHLFLLPIIRLVTNLMVIRFLLRIESGVLAVHLVQLDSFPQLFCFSLFGVIALLN
jgi:hypothetical protein